MTVKVRSGNEWVSVSGGGSGGESIGTIFAWSGTSSNIPSGYLLCDGAAISRTVYTALFALVGTTHGAGDGSTTFNIPNLKDRFIVGASNSSGDTTYPGVSPAATGGAADSIIAQHTHQLPAIRLNNYNDSTVSITLGSGQGYAIGYANNNVMSSSVTNTTGSTSTTNANLPPYYSLCYIIKVLNTTENGGSGIDVGVSRVAILKDEKENQKDGGSFTAAGWRDRDLTVEEDPSNFVTFTATPNGQSTEGSGTTPGYWSLPAGNYKIDWSAPGYDVNRHKSRLVYSTTQSHISTAGLNASASLVEGSTENNSVSENVCTHSTGYKVIGLTQTTWFKIMHYCSNTNSGEGFGRRQSSNPGSESVTGTNIYTQVRIEDLATITKSGVTVGDKIEEGNTSAEVIDTGTNGYFKVTTEGTERLRITQNGIVNMGRAVTDVGDPPAATGDVPAGIKLLGSTGPAGDGYGLMVNANSTIVGIFNRTASTGTILEFKNDATVVGSVATNGTDVTYASGSDYRLKENVVNLTDGITRLKTLNPYRFNFKSHPEKTVDGFLAHEVTAVPEAIIGTKDQVDSDNNPVYQQIDQSKLVPLLVSALQEAVAKIEILETKVAALEAG